MEDFLERDLALAIDERTFVFDQIYFSTGLDIWATGGFNFFIDSNMYAVYSTLVQEYDVESDEYQIGLLSINVQENTSTIKYFGTKTDFKVNKLSQKLLKNIFINEKHKVIDMFKIWWCEDLPVIVSINMCMFVLKGSKFTVMFSKIDAHTTNLPIVIMN